jgi:hypothetical protein
MGRWAQYRKRGGCAEGGPHLTLPPAPETAMGELGLTITAVSLHDEGGTFKVYKADSSDGDYVLEVSTEWDEEVLIDADDLETGKWYRVTELGNDVDYSGEGPPSFTLEYAP